MKDFDINKNKEDLYVIDNFSTELIVWDVYFYGLFFKSSFYKIMNNIKNSESKW